MTIQVSVVVATYNRGPKLLDLLQDLAAQTFAANNFEVIVIDDGSQEPVAPILQSHVWPYALRVETQANAGPAAARDRGVCLAQGDIVIITDDDMRLPANFISEHVAAHQQGATLVLGLIAPADDLAKKPIFERFHAYQLARFVEGVRRGKTKVRGVHVCTGNVSLRRLDYLKVGGFDQSLGRSEDRELGVRLEKAGAHLVFCERAQSIHESDHNDLQVWRKRAFNYGIYDRRIAQKHPDVDNVDPWRFFFLINPVSRPLMLISMLAPNLGNQISGGIAHAAVFSDNLGASQIGLLGATLCYGLDYFRGMRVEAGSFSQVLHDACAYWHKTHPTKKHNNPIQILIEGVRADYASLQRYRAKYHQEHISLWRMPIDIVRKIGFQTMCGIRLMHVTRDMHIPYLSHIMPQIISRILRHAYGVEIHWDAQFAPGVSIVHGVGLVVSHAARVGAGCILFHQVTLGEGIDPVTRQVGAPTLGKDVHVGPGSVLLGPIVIGDGSKIMAGSVVTQSVPPGSLVRPATCVVISRSSKKNNDTESAVV